MKTFLLLFFISTIAYTDCVELIRDHLSVPKEHLPLFMDVKTGFNLRETSFMKSVEKNKVSPIAPIGSGIYLREYITKFETNASRKALIEFIPSIYMNSPLIREWIRDLSRQVTRETFRSGSKADIFELSNRAETSRDIMIQVLKDRLKEAGFENPNIIVTKKELSEAEFSKVLRDRDLIVDDFFIADPHGPLIHLWQLDLIRFGAKKFGHDPRVLGEFYEWMGKNEKVYLPENQKTFSPLLHSWDLLFDSFRFDLTSPEIFNPFIESYFGM